MPVASDIILDWLHEDGYPLSESGWIRPQDHEFYFEVAAEKDDHRHIARAPDRERTTCLTIGSRRSLDAVSW